MLQRPEHSVFRAGTRLENIMVPTQGEESRAEASMGQRQDVEQVREWRRLLPPPWDLRFFHAREQLLFGNCTVIPLLQQALVVRAQQTIFE